MMRRTIFTTVMALGLAAGLPATQAGETTCDIEFHVSATMHKFTGTVQSEPITQIEGSEAWTVQVDVEKMTTDKKKRDKEMWHMFHSDEHPQIVGSTSAELGALGEADTFPVSLTISGETRELTATVSSVETSDDGVAVTVSFPVSLADYGLVPPKVMFFKVHDEVLVDALFRFPSS